MITETQNHKMKIKTQNITEVVNNWIKFTTQRSKLTQSNTTHIL